MMTFQEKIKSDIECLIRVLAKLKEYGADEKAIAVVSGMLDGAENMETEENANV